MKTVKFLILIVTLIFSCGHADAQFLKKLGDAAKNAAERAVTRKTEQKVEQTVDKTIDKVTDPDIYKGDGTNSSDNNNASNSGNSGSDGVASDNNSVSMPQGAKAIEMAYAKSDFVPGDEIFFEDDLANEKIGEFPSMWDMEQGNAEVAMLNGEKVIALIGYTIIVPLMKEKDYLPDEFTIEFDVLGDASNGYTETEMGFNPSRVLIPRLYINKDNTRFNGSWRRPTGEGGSQSEDIKTVKANEWIHVSISFNKRALKYYINGVRILNIPNMDKPNSFWIWQNGGNGNAYYRNIRIAKGAVPLYDRMMTDGKIITYGITFDVGKSTIKSESMGEINRIAKLMQDNPDLKFSVEGHTDSTGNAASNQTLSDARSTAVVDKLVEIGVAADRLSAAGKGQTSPIADNGTDEGRAKNRRVEFVKL
jgi:outer membrane protein OmpA-like peptidoglycan-associated protein